MIILPYGDSALLVNFEQKIDEAVNQQVIAVHQAASALPEVTFTIPAYCSLTIGFDKAQTDFESLKSQILSVSDTNSKKETALGDLYTIPVCYEDEFAPDMQEVCNITGLTSDKVIEIHTSTIFRVYMLGFVAGFAYLGSLPKSLYVPRKTTPRTHVAEGAVGLAGYQTGIYPTEAPGGWQLIGKTPVRTFNPTHESPALLKPGDRVQFRSVNAVEFETIQDSVKFGTYKPEVTNG